MLFLPPALVKKMLAATATCAVLSLTFPTPTARSKGWFPIGFARDFTASPKRVEVWGGKGDADTSALVAWRPKGKGVLVRPDVCPHLGARLSSSSKTLPNGCLQCAYHGVQIGPDAPQPGARALSGKCTEANGLVWWTHDAEEPSSPLCDDLLACESRTDTTLAQWSMRVHASFSDCFRNGMDLHHAGWLHASTFGNKMEDPKGTRTQITGNDLRVEFEYVSNSAFRDVTGSTTSNYHVFRKPSTTWNKVTSEDGQKFVFIHVAMRPINEELVEWYVTSASNYIPMWLPLQFRQESLEKITRRIAQKEDRVQLERMATEAAKQEHSNQVKLTLDTVYDEWIEFVKEEKEDEDKSPRFLKDVRDTNGMPAAARALWLRSKGEHALARAEEAFVSDAMRAFLHANRDDARAAAWNEYIPHRTQMVDDAILHQLETLSSIDTVVLLGSGADTRAHRLPLLSHLNVIEVDYPSVIETKTKAVKELANTRHVPVKYVSADLNGDPDLSALAASPDTTLFVAEGLLYYFNESHVATMLAQCDHVVADILNVVPSDMTEFYKFITPRPVEFFRRLDYGQVTARRVPGRFGTVVTSASRQRSGNVRMASQDDEKEEAEEEEKKTRRLVVQQQIVETLRTVLAYCIGAAGAQGVVEVARAQKEKAKEHLWTATEAL